MLNPGYVNPSFGSLATLFGVFTFEILDNSPLFPSYPECESTQK